MLRSLIYIYSVILRRKSEYWPSPSMRTSSLLSDKLEQLDLVSY